LSLLQDARGSPRHLGRLRRSAARARRRDGMPSPVKNFRHHLMGRSAQPPPSSPVSCCSWLASVPMGGGRRAGSSVGTEHARVACAARRRCGPNHFDNKGGEASSRVTGRSDPSPHQARRVATEWARVFVRSARLHREAKGEGIRERYKLGEGNKSYDRVAEGKMRFPAVHRPSIPSAICKSSTR
jgi:hypothetical protein